MSGVATLSFALVFATGLAAQDSPSYQSFDVPGSVNTYSLTINRSATTAGYSVDANGVYHGFVRSEAGGITAFDDVEAGSLSNQGTIATSINDSGTTAGYFADAHSRYHAFERSAAGTIVSFDGPSAVNTFGEGINNEGIITGYYVDSSNRSHGFERSSAGVITSFDDPGVPPGETSNTTPYAINASGVTGGSCGCPAYLAFVRDVAGDIVNFKVGAFSSGVASINNAGTAAGFFLDSSTGPEMGFVRAADGAVTKFSVPGTGVSTIPAGINAEGVVTGSVYVNGGASHGFLRTLDGTVTLFDDPSAGSAANQGTNPTGVNKSLSITGYYDDASGAVHGFLRTP